MGRNGITFLKLTSKMLMLTAIAAGISACSFSKVEDEKPATAAVVNPEVKIAKIQQLFDAIASSNSVLFREVLKDLTAEDVNTINASNETPLEMSVRSNQALFVELLLEKGALPLSYASDGSIENGRTIVIMAMDHEKETHLNPKILSLLNATVEKQKVDFESKLQRTDFREAWMTVGKYRMAAIGYDIKLIQAIVAKVGKVGSISSDDKALMLELIEDANRSANWNNLKLSAVVETTLITGNIEYVKNIRNSRQGLVAAASPSIRLSNKLDTAVIDETIKLLAKQSIECSLSSFSDFLVARLVSVISERSAKNWDEFIWVLKKIEVARPMENAAIRDGLLDYAIDYFYVQSKPMGSAFSVEDISMVFELAKKINGSLNISVESMDKITAPNARYQSSRENVIRFLGQNVSEVGKEFWKKVFTKSVAEIDFYFRTLPTGNLSLGEVMDLVKGIDLKSANPIDLQKFLMQMNLNSVKYDKSEYLSVLETNWKSSWSEKSYIYGLIVSKLIAVGATAKIILTEEELNSIRSAEFLLILNKKRDVNQFCLLNSVSASLPSTVQYQIKGLNYKFSISGISKIYNVDRNFSDFSQCYLSKNDFLVSDVSNGGLISEKEFLTYALLGYKDLIQSSLRGAMEFQFPYLMSSDVTTLRLEAFDKNAYKKIADKIVSGNDVPSFRKLIKDTFNLSKLNYSVNIDETVLPAIRAMVSDRKVNSGYYDHEVAREIIGYIQKSNLRFFVSFYEPLENHYDKFLQDPAIQSDPITIVTSTYSESELMKLKNYFNGGGYSLDFDKLTEKKNVVIKAPPISQKKDVVGPIRRPGISMSEIDDVSFEIIREINDTLKDQKYWQSLVNTWPKVYRKFMVNSGQLNIDIKEMIESINEDPNRD
ncbi:MAG: hypothetical protein V4736_01930 [Bdellovibrionota bacterium]